MKHSPLIRTIYLYLFTIIGLVLVVIGSARFVDMGLRTFVFTKAEANQSQDYNRLRAISYSMERIEIMQNDENFAEEERVIMRQMIDEYKNQDEEVSHLTIKRHRDASTNLAMILVGLPLYFYHWRIIRRETKA